VRETSRFRAKVLVQVAEVLVETTWIRVELGRGLEGEHLRRRGLDPVPCRDELERLAGHESQQEEVDADGDPGCQQIEADAGERYVMLALDDAVRPPDTRTCRHNCTPSQIHMPSLVLFCTARLIPWHAAGSAIASKRV
jgi:hypothetical protein